MVAVILVWSGKLTFGLGLGDLAYALPLTFATLLYGGLVSRAWKNESVRKNRCNGPVILLTAMILHSYFVYHLTVGRGPEYPWNGNLFFS